MERYLNNQLISLTYKGYKIKQIVNNDVIVSIEREKYEIPYLSYKYWNPKPYDTEEVIIPLYITDFYQVEYLNNDDSLRFKLRVEIDGEITWYNNLKAGDYDLNLGKFEAGEHWFTLEVIDQWGESSGRISNDLWVRNKEEYEIKDNEIYNITNEDLISYNITVNLDSTATAEQMQNNRLGLTQLLSDKRNEGYRKVILPNAIYRVNRALRIGKIADGTSCIVIPSGLTVDMNESTFKLHPYNDSEYGSIAGVENLIVSFYNCIDSHLINGTIEGDFAERKANGWLSSNNGEHNNTIYMYGGRYNSIENLIIKQTTGYNVCTGQAGNEKGWNNVAFGTVIDGIRIVDGIEVECEGYSTTTLSDLSNNKSGYIVTSVWLGYGGIRTNHWDIDYSFYDENQNFIETIRCYQYRRCRIPQGAKYVRTTWKGSSSEVINTGYHHMNVARYSEFKNCHWIDNRTCCAPFQHQHLLIDNCDFTRSGQSITPCEIDLEDGWEQQQDFFLMNSNVYEHMGTGGLIDNSGINHVVENCNNWNLMFRYRIIGIEVRNNVNCQIGITMGFMTRNTIRAFDNEFTTSTCSRTDANHYLSDVTKCIYKNNNVLKFAGGTSKEDGHVENCNVTIPSYHSGYVKNCTVKIISGAAYTYDPVFENCTFILNEGETQTKFSFNGLDHDRRYINCIFNTPCFFASHNYFNSAIFKDCTFNEYVILENKHATKALGQIAFINCKFNKKFTVRSSNNSYVEFVNCEFAEEIEYSNDTAKNLCVFNDKPSDKISYIEMSGGVKYYAIGETSTYSAFALPLYVENKNISWSTNNENVGTIDENGKFTAKALGDITIKATSQTGLVEEKTATIVDVDYTKGQDYYYDGYAYYVSGVSDNRYRTVTGGKSITVSLPGFSWGRLCVVQYDANKNYLSFNVATNSNPVTTTLKAETAYIRVAFRLSTSETRFTEAMYTYIITENN